MMRKRSALLSLFTIFFLTITLLEGFTPLVSAHNKPLTSPITAPLTSFAHRISGKITIKHFTFKHFFSRFTPASGVMVTLQNIKTNEKMTTQTDGNGVYSFFATDGWYKISPKKTPSADIITPPFRFVTIHKHDTLHQDFQMLDLP